MSKQKYKAPYDRTRGGLMPRAPIKVNAKTVSILKNGTVTTVNSPSYVTLPVSTGRVIYDRVTPGYKQRSAMGEIINNPMSIVVEDFGLQPYSGVIFHGFFTNSSGVPLANSIDDTVYYENYIPDPSSSYFPAVPTIATKAMEQDAINAAFASAHQRDVMGMVDLAEIGKTKDMLVTNLSRFESIIKGIPLTKDKKRIGKWKSVNPAFKYVAKTPMGKLAALSGLWLEYHYGLIPTMMSIEGLMKVLSDQTKPVRQTFRSNKSYNTEMTDSKTTLDNGFSWATPYPSGRKVIGTVSITHNSYARAGVITDYKPTTRESLGLTGRDVFPAAYELIPFSFVLDWTLNLGDAIEALTPVPGFNNLASWITLVKEETVEYRLRATYAKQTTSVQSITWNEYEAAVWCTRQTRTRTPGVLPGLPHWDFKFKSLTHAISGVALALSRARRTAGKRL